MQIRKDLRLRRHRALHRNCLRPAAAAARAHGAPRGGLGAWAMTKRLPTEEKNHHEPENEHGHEHEHEDDDDDDDDVLMFEMGELIGYSLTLLGEGEGCCFDAG